MEIRQEDKETKEQDEGNGKDDRGSHDFSIGHV